MTRKFGYALSDPRYTWNLEVTPGVSRLIVSGDAFQAESPLSPREYFAGELTPKRAAVSLARAGSPFAEGRLKLAG